MLRDYQQLAIEQIYQQYRHHTKRTLLWLATGAGKTVIFCELVKRAVAKGSPVLIVVRGRKLVDQASQRLIREGVEHGVLMAKHWRYRPHLPVQVCSIDTIIARKIRPKGALIILDEAHLAISKGYRDFIDAYPDAFFLPVTATPWVPEGLAHVANSVVHPVTMSELIAQGYLVDFVKYAPSTPDLSKVKTDYKSHDYVTSQLEEAMTKGQLTGRIIDHWRALAEGRPTLCFAVNIRHSEYLIDMFARANIKAEHVDANTPDHERLEIIQRLENGQTQIVCNVGIFCTGVDIPSLGCIIMGRPTQSRNLFIQQAGRGTRPIYAEGDFRLDTVEGRLSAIRASGKPNCILLDHAGNIGRHGFPTDEPEVLLAGAPRGESEPRESKVCKNCFAVYRGSKCPQCGKEAPKTTEILEETDDRLVEVNELSMPEEQRMLDQLVKQARQSGKKKQWAYYRLIDKFGFERVRDYLPDYFVKNYINSNKKFANSPFSFGG